MTQVLVNGLAAGATYALLAFGFALVYATTGVFHFAHGAVYALAGYGFWWALEQAGWPAIAAAALGLLLAVLLGCLVDAWLYRPLRARSAPVDVQFLSSLGLFGIVSNALALAFGHQAHPLTRLGVGSLVLRPAPEPGLPPVVVTSAQLWTLAATAVCFVAAWALMRFTRFGLATRAYAANPALAEVLGVDRSRLLLGVTAAGSLLAGIAALCVAADVGVSPEMGLAAVVTGAVAVVIGGVGSLPGTAVCGLLLGLAQHLLSFGFAARWSEALTFVVLLVVLLVRPNGLFGPRR